MAKIILDDASVVVNSVDLSASVQSVTINYEAEQQDCTTMGQDTRANKGGLKNWSIDVTFVQDWDAASVDATIFPIVGGEFPIVVKPTSAAVSATNPSYSSTATIASYSPIGNSVGDLAVAPVSFMPSGTGSNPNLVRATS